MDSRNNLWQRANQAMPYFAAVTLVLIVGATAIGMLCSVASDPPPGESCMECVREWIGSLAGWFAVLAAMATVQAIRHQVQAAREDSLRIASQTKLVVDSRLENILRNIELGWRFLDCHDDPDISEDNQQRARNLARPHVSQAISDRDLTEIEGALPHMLPIDRQQLRSVLRSLRQLRDLTRNRTEEEHNAFWGLVEDDGLDEADKATTLGIHLSHLANDVRKYDQKLHKIFEVRRKYNVNDDPMWKLAEEPVNERIARWRTGSED